MKTISAKFACINACMCVKFNKAIIMIIIIFWWEFEFISYVWDIMWIDYFLIVLVWLAYVFVVELYMYVCMCSILKLWYFYFQIQWFSMILQTAKTIQQLLRWEYHPIRKTTDFIKSLQTKDFTTLNPLKRKKNGKYNAVRNFYDTFISIAW